MLSCCDMSRSLPTAVYGSAWCDSCRNSMLSSAQPFSRIRRVALLFGFLAVTSAGFTKSPVESIPSQAAQLRSTDIIHRPTSQPYTGDLSVFEDPKRDKNL